MMSAERMQEIREAVERLSRLINAPYTPLPCDHKYPDPNNLPSVILNSYTRRCLKCGELKK